MALGYYLGDVILGIAAIAATLLLAERFDGIGPWSKAQIVFMLGYGMAGNGLMDVFGGYNVNVISRRLGRGQLDHTLIQPQPVWMALLTDGFSPCSGSGKLLPGVGLIAWAASQLSLPADPAWLAVAALNFVASATILVCYSFLWGSLAFWAPRAAEEISASAINMMKELRPFPLDGLGPLLLGGLLTLLPAGFVAWLPCRALLGLDQSGYGAAITPVAAAVFLALTAWVFDRGMKHYGRTGSQRYLSMGHRG
jgi:ABC-type uncharacterized transport system permease subunit